MMADDTVIPISLRVGTEQLEAVRRAFSGCAGSRCVRLSLQKDSEVNGEAELPGDLLAGLAEALGHLGRGESVTLIPAQTEVNPQEAADLLGVSPACLRGLLARGTLGWRAEDGQQRVSLNDLLAYKTKLDRRRARGLEALAG